METGALILCGTVSRMPQTVDIIIIIIIIIIIYLSWSWATC